MRLAVWVLAGAVAMVMLIVCANLSNLLLARTASRQKEIAIRTALGAGRRRLLAQMLTEGIVLSCSGALLGLLLAFVGTRALARLDAVSIPLLRDVRTDATALGFTLAIALVTGIVFGLAPALQARGAALTNALKDATRGSTEGRPAHLGPQRAGRLGDRVRVRAARRRRPPHPQPDSRARRRHGLRPGARRHDSRRSRQPLCARANSATPTSTRCCAG